MKIRLRDFRLADFDALWRIDQQCFEPGIAYSRLELGAYIRRPGAFTLVAEGWSDSPAGSGQRTGDVAITGFIVAEANRRRVGHIISIDVLPQARRSGVGSRLLQAGEERLQLAGCHGVVLEAAVDNQTALAFYKRHDYTVLKTISNYYSNGVDALVLGKALKPHAGEQAS